MRHSYAQLFYYVTWKTESSHQIPKATITKLGACIKTICTNAKAQARAIEITGNSMHVIIKMPGKNKLSTLVGKIKESSSHCKWERTYKATSFHQRELLALKNIFRNKQYHLIDVPDIKLLYHITWATKKRLPLIPRTIEQKLHLHIETLAYKRDIEIMALGGTHNHIHILVKLPGHHSLSNFVSNIKSRTNVFINDLTRKSHYFAWQNGYGAFTIHPSRVATVKKYILNQHEHHRTATYQQELNQYFAPPRAT